MIDISLAVPDSADEAAYVPALGALGYQLRIGEPGWHQHRMLRGDDPATNLHVYSIDCPEIERTLIFRDRLRSHPAERELYERTKRAQARRRWAQLPAERGPDGEPSGRDPGATPFAGVGVRAPDERIPIARTVYKE